MSRQAVEADIRKKKETTRRRRLRLFFTILGLLAVVLGVIGFYILKYYRIYFEQEPPTITVVSAPRALGVHPAHVVFEVSDRVSGLDEVVVRIEKRNESKDLIRRRYWGKDQYADRLELDLNGKDPLFAEGKVRLVVKVFDKAFWSNSTIQTFEIPIDLVLPKVEAVSTQHNGVQGGTQLVVLRATDNRLDSAGVVVRDKQYPGFPIGEVSPEFKGLSNVFLAFYPIPIDFNEESEQIKLYAEDVGGNVAYANFYNKARAIRFFLRRPEVPWEFLDGQVRLVYEKYIKDYQGGKDEVDSFANLADVTRVATERFATIVDKYIPKTEERIRDIEAHPVKAMLWDGPFGRVGGTQVVLFGEKREHYYQGQLLGTFVSTGVDFASVPQSQALAANKGLVVFAGDLGPYGNTVILDHGFGLATHYSYLSNISVSVGDTVEKGALLGRVGMTGLALSERLHFEVRIDGVPVNPVEWWDRGWVQGHIEAKFNDVRKQFGLQAPTDESPTEPTLSD